MVLRHPYARTSDAGQALELILDGKEWRPRVNDGLPQQQPTFTAPAGKRGKSARCPFPNCGHVHNLDVIKAKGFADQYADAMVAVAEVDPETNRKVFRAPFPAEIDAALVADVTPTSLFQELEACPNEKIPKTAGVDAR